MIDSRAVDERKVVSCILENSYVIKLENMKLADVCMLIEKKWIEVQNGLPVSSIVFTHSIWSEVKIKEFVYKCRQELIKNNAFTWSIKSFIFCKENKVFMLSFYNDFSNIQSGKEQANKISEDETIIIKKYNEKSIIDKANILNDISNGIQLNIFSDDFVDFLKKISSENVLVTSTLASEILTQNGYFTVPNKLWHNSGQLHTESSNNDNQISSSNKVSTIFEEKIDVDSYNFFEVVHPAYAKQCVILSDFIKKYFEISKQINCIDVGTGCGTPLIMIKEMIPNLFVHAIEPSEIAFKYLKENIGKMDKVKLDKVGFLELELDNKVPLIMSTGASHHFNTYFFFQKSKELLSKDGLLIVADEFISPFKNINERNRNLILHHTSYMLSILFEVSKDITANLTSEEIVLKDLLTQYIPIANFYASFNYVEQAKAMCEKLLNIIDELPLSTKISNPFTAFYRLQVLELEALVAGLCYEVEQKTYPERFIKMAILSGFKLLEHVRVHKTDGMNELDAGTHVFVFKK